ncbi:hypothetical protein PLICRDRAFT_93429 [Plicaturopsis crispa FD-325 SS-3]|nr:hypothetical protein PLICRDRAFT_93429 [Plicaturopsis crispa FD-325 SS-3]
MRHSYKEMCPISRVPNEIIAHIFTNGSFDIGDGSLPFPVLVSHVCHHWRVVAINLSSLWSCIYSTSPFVHFPLALLDLYLQRSRACKLNIDVHAEPPEFYLHLAHDAYRWISFTERKLTEPVHELLCQLRTPHLRHLSILDAAPVSKRAYMPMPTGAVPALSTVTLAGSVFSKIGFRGYDTLRGVKTLTLSGRQASLHLMSPLSAATSLRTLCIHDFALAFCSTVTQQNGLARIRLPLVTTLELQPHPFTQYGCGLGPLSLGLETPALEHLILKTAYPRNVRDFTEAFALHPAAERYPRPYKLTLYGSWLSAELMRAVPSITHLVFRPSHICNERRFLAALESAVDDVGRPLWLLLRRLSIERCIGAFTDPAIAIQRRIDGGCPIEVLTLECFSHVMSCADKVEWLRQHVCLEIVNLGAW